MCRDNLINKTNINLLVAVEQMSEDHHSNEDSSPRTMTGPQGMNPLLWWSILINPDQSTVRILVIHQTRMSKKYISIMFALFFENRELHRCKFTERIRLMLPVNFGFDLKNKNCCRQIQEHKSEPLVLLITKNLGPSKKTEIRLRDALWRSSSFWLSCDKKKI